MSAVGHSGIMREGGGAIVTRGRGAVVMGCQRVASRSVILSTGTPLLSLYNLLLSFPQLGLAKSRRAPCTLKDRERSLTNNAHLGTITIKKVITRRVSRASRQKAHMRP